MGIIYFINLCVLLVLSHGGLLPYMFGHLKKFFVVSLYLAELNLWVSWEAKVVRPMWGQVHGHVYKKKMVWLSLWFLTCGRDWQNSLPSLFAAGRVFFFSPWLTLPFKALACMCLCVLLWWASHDFRLNFAQIWAILVSNFLFGWPLIPNCWILGKGIWLFTPLILFTPPVCCLNSYFCFCFFCLWGISSPFLWAGMFLTLL